MSKQKLKIPGISICFAHPIVKLVCQLSLVAMMMCTALHLVWAQTSGAPQTATPVAPAWAEPGSPTHVQVAPPADFHRPSTNFDMPVGIFEGQSEIGSALVPGGTTYDASTGQYSLIASGYNIWYQRDEFRYLWKKMSGDVSIAADISYPDPKGFSDRKAVLVIRQDLDDDSKEVIITLHGSGMLQLGERPQKHVGFKDMEYRIADRGLSGAENPNSLVTVMAKRLGLEKRGDAFAIFVSQVGEPMHQFGPPITLHIDGPFYAGIGFCSHLPVTLDTAVFSNVIIENSAGQVH